MREIASVLLLAIALNANAESREEKVETIMRAQGLVQTLEEQMVLGKERGKALGNQILSQLMSELNPPEQFQIRFKVAAETFLSAIESPWTAQNIVQSLSNHYGSKFSDSELDQLLAFYSSPIAQKEVIAGREALMALSNELQERTKPIMEKAIFDFVANLKEISTECACRK